jgi:hypothetical protein
MQNAECKSSQLIGDKATSGRLHVASCKLRVAHRICDL